MSLKNDIDYKLQIFVIILLFILTNVIVFFNKQIKYFEGLIIFYGILVILIMANLKIKKESFNTKTDDNYIKLLERKFFELSQDKQKLDQKVQRDYDEIDRYYEEMNKKIENYSEKILGIQFSDLLKERINYTYKNIGEEYCDNKEILECEKEPFCEYDYDNRKCKKVSK